MRSFVMPSRKVQAMVPLKMRSWEFLGREIEVEILMLRWDWIPLASYIRFPDEGSGSRWVSPRCILRVVICRRGSPSWTFDVLFGPFLALV